MAEIDPDREAIIELIHRNRIAIWTGDMEGWARCFVHAGYTARWGYWRQGGTFARRGWDDIAARARIGAPPPNPAYAYDTRVENLSLQIGNDMAWATYDQIYPGSLDDHVGPGVVSEMRVFEKHDGQWLIAFIGFLDSNAGAKGAVMLRLDAAGQVLWQSPSAAAAIEASDDVAIRNGRLRFRSARTDRKLQEALRWAATLDNAYMSTHGALPIVVDPVEGEPTRIYWLVVDAGMIVFSFGTEGINAERLKVAAIIYELSPAQTRLCALVAEGLTLNEIAQRMAITPNTARTHLNRVFDKTGVRTQPALVRVLLTATSPL